MDQVGKVGGVAGGVLQPMTKRGEEQASRIVSFINQTDSATDYQQGYYKSS